MPTTQGAAALPDSSSGRRAAMSRPLAWGEPLRRGVAAGLVLSVHLLALLLLMRPAMLRPTAAATVRPAGRQALRLRFLRRPAPAPTAAGRPAIRMASASPHLRPAPSPHPQPAAPPPRSETARLPASLPWLSAAAAAAVATEHPPGTIADGGFQQRLLQARQAHAVHGVPGSDAPVVGGIHLADPATQGVGAVMRRVQRLFGVANRHCIDVEAWRNMTPQALSARHISPREVDQVDEAYHCNEPPGLHF